MAEQVHALTRSLATNSDMPEEYQVLGRILNAILSGERAKEREAAAQKKQQ